jgi:release factor glutamine methyltransferase
MKIRNNLLSQIKRDYLQDLVQYYDEREAEQLLTILIEHFFGISRNELIMKPEYRISESEIVTLINAVKDLKKYKPVQYITGVVEFHGLLLRVNPDTLIPRPETEELVQLIAESEKAKGLSVLDIGTGSGCVAIVLSKLLEYADVYATDISIPAISLARKNALSNNQDVQFHVHDIQISENPIKNNDGQTVMFDVIVSNPPYVTQSDKKKMHRNVVDYEPAIALFVTDGNPLEFYISILNFCEKYLVQGGRVYMEINEGMGEEIELLLTKFRYADIELRRDLNGKQRFVSATKILR